MIEISQLHTLIAVANAGSFSKAAEELNVTQSAISQSVKNLENRIDVKLFRRSGKKVVLTPEGEKLFLLASDFISELENTVEEIQYDKEKMAGKISIGTLTGIGKSWLAPHLLELATEFPELSLRLRLGFEDDLVKEFERLELDFIILPEDDLPVSGERVLLSEERCTLVFPKSKFNIDEDITLDRLSKLPTILFEKEDSLYTKWCRERFGEVPRKVNQRYIINSHGNMLQAVMKGLGVAVIPTHVLKRSYYRDKISNLGKDFEVSNGKFYLVYRENCCEELVRMKYILERLVERGSSLSSDIWA